ncbi:aspartate aminotransferase family protein [Lottiidibacillus patelloidae]|uniref:Aspartate aminotransferase family protein n=1 Tax=Lottiidibacillus patelloidae TaxID=2670334 RepID=A0A263BXE0_9BACI|nr:aminotransferase class III-fold pyridoxal phosphate-dependent enzyme [Lottiidibacillus patelloidae]OZM58403.1 aspartate aminotransferase family protein [Lottiidibacillus patelloidae]
MTDWQKLDEQYVMKTYNRLPIVVEKAIGNKMYDTNGNEYLDLFTGLAVNIIGHSHPKILQAIKKQSENFLHISNVFYNKPAIELAKKLVDNSIKGKVFFVNSGAEATESAVKVLHKFKINNNIEREGIVVLKKSFHGRTLGALKLTRQPNVYQDFPVPNYPVYEVEPENIAALEAIFAKEKPLAIIMEPVLGSGGVKPLSVDYLQKVEQLCRQYEVLLGMDEIQTGVGRTGNLFAYQHANITPDLILFAKGIGGGLPLGGIIAGEKLQDMFKPGDHGTTFAPSPLSAALGNAVIDELLAGQMEKGKSQAQKLWNEIQTLKDKNPSIKELRGKGMMIGIVMNLEAAAVSKIQKTLLDKGIMVDVTQQTIIRLLPPLTLTDEEIKFFIDTFSPLLEEVANV